MVKSYGWSKLACEISRIHRENASRPCRPMDLWPTRTEMTKNSPACAHHQRNCLHTVLTDVPRFGPNIKEPTLFTRNVAGQVSAFSSEAKDFFSRRGAKGVEKCKAGKWREMAGKIHDAKRNQDGVSALAPRREKSHLLVPSP